MKTTRTGAVTGARPRRIEWLMLLAATVALLALRLPFLPPTLEDIDSVNFDLGLRSCPYFSARCRVIPLYWLMRRLTCPSSAAFVCVLTLFNPFVWFNSVRPMSDLTGFFLVMATQCLLLTALCRAITLLNSPTQICDRTPCRSENWCPSLLGAKAP